MAIIKPNNNTISAITALPAAIPTGKVLQVVNGFTYTKVQSTSTTYADTGLTASITPSSTSNKVLVIINQGMVKSTHNTYGGLKLLRDSTELGFIGDLICYTGASDYNVNGASASFFDNPSSTSSLTYKTQFANVPGTGNVDVQPDSSSSTERGRGSITLMEIVG
tara:strand:+ start:238 stop:732 length:495 start_codon:yes stop_codon:yes gene_type:complete